MVIKIGKLKNLNLYFDEKEGGIFLYTKNIDSNTITAFSFFCSRYLGKSVITLKPTFLKVPCEMEELLKVAKKMSKYEPIKINFRVLRGFLAKRFVEKV